MFIDFFIGLTVDNFILGGKQLQTHSRAGRKTIRIRKSGKTFQTVTGRYGTDGA